jgi:hypothetical protein
VHAAQHAERVAARALAKRAADERRLELTQLRAIAGAAQANAKLLLVRSGPGERADWRLARTARSGTERAFQMIAA